MRAVRISALVVAIAACDNEPARIAVDTVAVDPGGAAEAVRQGMKCTMGSVLETQVDCRYRVGRGLDFEIAGVGRDDASITVYHADGLDADYYMTFGVLHGCVIVKGNVAASVEAGLGLDMAFISPKDGQVYRTWQECQSAG